MKKETRKERRVTFRVENMPKTQNVFLHHEQGVYVLSYEEAEEFYMTCRKILSSPVDYYEFNIDAKGISKHFESEKLVVNRENIWKVWVDLKKIFRYE